MKSDNAPKSGDETYIWDKGYPYPTEQERVIIFVCSCIESVAERLKCKVA